MPTLFEVTEWHQFLLSLKSVQSSQHDHISNLLYANVFEQMYRGDHFVFEHGTRRPGMNCVFASPLHDQANLELMCFLFGACRVFVLGKLVEGTRQSFHRRSRKSDSVGDAVLTVDNVVKTQNGCELEGKKISKGSGRYFYEIDNKAAISIGAAESTSKTMVVADAKEKEKLVPLTIVKKKPETQVRDS